MREEKFLSLSSTTLSEPQASTLISAMAEYRENVGGRFGVIEKLFKIAGIPVTSDEKSFLYSVYQVLVVTSGYLTLLTTFVGILKNLDDMEYVMEVARPGFVMINLVWMHFFTRYYFLRSVDDLKCYSSYTEKKSWYVKILRRVLRGLWQNKLYFHIILKNSNRIDRTNSVSVSQNIQGNFLWTNYIINHYIRVFYSHK